MSSLNYLPFPTTLFCNRVSTFGMSVYFGTSVNFWYECLLWYECQLLVQMSSLVRVSTLVQVSTFCTSVNFGMSDNFGACVNIWYECQLWYECQHLVKVSTLVRVSTNYKYDLGPEVGRKDGWKDQGKKRSRLDCIQGECWMKILINCISWSLRCLRSDSIRHLVN